MCQRSGVRSQTCSVVNKITVFCISGQVYLLHTGVHSFAIKKNDQKELSVVKINIARAIKKKKKKKKKLCYAHLIPAETLALGW